jgi:hypothetical protein
MRQQVRKAKATRKQMAFKLLLLMHTDTIWMIKNSNPIDFNKI